MKIGAVTIRVYWTSVQYRRCDYTSLPDIGATSALWLNEFTGHRRNIGAVTTRVYWTSVQHRRCDYTCLLDTGATLTDGRKWNSDHTFLHFSSDSHTVLQRTTKLYRVTEFRENRCSESHIFTHFIHALQIWCPIWIKFGLRNLNIMLFSICDIRENRLTEGHTLLMGVNKIKFTWGPLKKYGFQKIKNRLCEVCVLHHIYKQPLSSTLW